jgi:hypothetical protein
MRVQTAFNHDKTSEEVTTMRSIREIYEKAEQGLYPCQYPKCREYGNIASQKWGVVCQGHSPIF